MFSPATQHLLSTPASSRWLNTCREIEGLRSVKLSASPWPKSRPRGVKAKGLRYERALAKVIPSAKHGLWFNFVDRNGPGFCSPDFIIEGHSFVAVLECKLTDTDEARKQIRALYTPILEKFYSKPVLGVVVAKYLTPNSRNIVHDLASALKLTKNSAIATLHWLGKGPI